MAFTVSDFHDLIHILKTKPEWKEALRRELLGDEIIRIPEEFIALQKALRLLIEEFHGFRSDTEERLKQLKVDVSQLKVDVSQLKGDVSQLKTNVADLQGERVERKYRDRPNVYFNQIVRKAKSLTDLEIANLLDDAEEQGFITEAEANYIRRSDAIIIGRAKMTGETLYLTVEASVVLDAHDAQRAAERAKLLNKIPNMNAIGVIAGDKIDPKSTNAIQNEKVWCITNGTVIEVMQPS